MPNFNKCTVEFSFEFGTIGNKTMSVEIQTPNKQISVVPHQLDSKLINITTIEVDLPTQIMLKFTGKDYNTDTVIDENGKIVQDIYVKILSVSMDGFKLNEKFLHQKIKIFTDQEQEYTTAYIGFNGVVTLDLVEDTVFSQYLTLNA
jgi:hypothetical protein